MKDIVDVHLLNVHEENKDSSKQDADATLYHPPYSAQLKTDLLRLRGEEQFIFTCVRKQDWHRHQYFVWYNSEIEEGCIYL